MTPRGNRKNEIDTKIQIEMQNLREFLEINKSNVDAETIFQVLQSHDEIDECIKYAETIERYDVVIVHYINKQDFEQALGKVFEIKDETKRNDTMLRYASLFVIKKPH